MHKIAWVIVLLAFGIESFSQTAAIDKLIGEGVELFDKGLYNEAIIRYEKVLKINAKNRTARYELAYTHFVQGNYDKTIEHSRIIYQTGGEYWVDAVVLYGASLENTGKSKRAIKLFEEAMLKNPDHSLLRYNAALSYFSLKNYAQAERNVILSLEQNHSNPSAHLLLANVMVSRGEKVKSMLALYYFLLLEQDSERSTKAFDLLVNLWEHLLKSGKVGSGSKPLAGLPDFKRVEINISKPDFEIAETGDLGKFVQNTEWFHYCIYNNLWETSGFWKERYLTFYGDVYKNGHAKSLGYFAAQCKYKADVLQWLSDNYQLFNSFANWMSQQ